MPEAIVQLDPILDLQQIVGTDHVLTKETSDSPYLRDWTGDFVSTPRCVVRPASTEEVAAVVRCAYEHSLSVVTQGGNTGLVGGTHTLDPETSIILNTGRLNRIRRIDETNFSIEVEAGCILQSVQEYVAEYDLNLPISFGAQGSAQIGGVVSSNAGGLNVLKFGMTRDMVLGLEVVLPNGDILNTLSHLRKDNRGLDLKQIFVGTEGTLGVITAVSLKLFPQTHQRETALVAVANLPAAIDFFTLARRHCSDLLTAFELISRPCIDLALAYSSDLRDPLQESYDHYILFELAASGPIELRPILDSLLEKTMEDGRVLDGTLAENDRQRNELWQMREAMVEAQAHAGRHMRSDVSVAVSQIPEFISEAEKLFASVAGDWQTLVYGHIGDGNIHFNALPPISLNEAGILEKIPHLHAALYALVDQFNGSLSAEHGIGRTRKEYMISREQPIALRLSNCIKALIDPEYILNKGCLFSQGDAPEKSKA